VTIEDFEDIARLASPAVARVKSVPLWDLMTGAGRPGVVSVIVVPRSSDPQPTPGIQLLEEVRDYIVERAIPTADVVVVGPEYVPTDVDLEVVPVSLEGAGDVEAAIQQALSRFLHPLTGGLDGTGWDFGRQPHDSDFYVLLESVAGVDHVRSLRVTPRGAFDAGRFLVCSGTHRVALRFEAPDQ
jgi:predicted phage baseplate assembly protein